jgi:hypothetical protein
MSVTLSLTNYISTNHGASKGRGGAMLQAPPNRSFKNTDFADMTIYKTFYVIFLLSKISHWNRLMSLGCILEFWKIKQTLGCLTLIKRKTGLDLVNYSRWVSHGTCSYIRMFINAVAKSVISLLHFWHDFYHAIFKIKHKLYTAAVSVSNSLNKCLRRATTFNYFKYQLKDINCGSSHWSKANSSK